MILSCPVDGFVHPLNNFGLVIIQDARLSVGGNGFYLPPIRVLVRKWPVKLVFILISFQAIPFLLELRSVLDWVCTDTTLTLYHWLKMEDIYANIYVLKCYRESEKVGSCMGCTDNNTWARGDMEFLFSCSIWIFVPIVQSVS